jgi:membrane protease YdiL (CAAX protease family)
LITNNLILLISEWLGIIAVIILLRLSSRFKHPPLVFLYPRREGTIALSLFGLIMLFSIVFSAQVGLPISPPSSLSVLNRRLVLAFICLVPFVISLIIRQQPLRSAGLRKDTLGPSLRLSLALAFLTIFLRGKVFNILNGITYEEILALLVWMGICLAEEIIFRGYLHPRFCASLGKKYGWAFTAVLFTLWRVPFVQAEPLQIILSLSIALIQGLILGWLVEKTGNVTATALYRSVSEWVGFLQ